ncbi:MAG: hypothetical protein A3208_00380 [Candidatus Methanoprimaticola hominis]|nr:MAG: hypothetical protein A3208_00380 [Methanomassiliicoccales archaeon Mx-06]
MTPAPATALAISGTGLHPSIRFLDTRYPTNTKIMKTGKNLTRTARANVIPPTSGHPFLRQYMVRTANIAATVSGIEMTPVDISSTGDRNTSANANRDLRSSPVDSCTSFMTTRAVTRSQTNSGSLIEYMAASEGIVAEKYGPEPSTNSASATRTADSPISMKTSWNAAMPPRMYPQTGV